jgi:Tfp pilus assembly protein PilN
MNAMTVLGVLWAVLTTVLVVILIYRSALTMHEDDQLFLDSAEAHLEKEQQQLRMKQDRLQPYINILGASSGLLVLLMAGLWLWRGWKGM